MKQLTKTERERLESFARLTNHIRATRARELHLQRGHRDEDGNWVGGLYEFVKYFWHVLEPEAPMVPGWAMEAICEHLEAVTYGEIKRLLINVPPGFSKSLLTDVYWPAWSWATGRGHLRFLAFSYSSSLTERDNRRFADLVNSKEFRDLYGKQFSLVKCGDKLVSNSRKGWKLASSVGGVGTGERGDVVICFPYRETIWTEIGPLPIGEVVERRLNVRAWSLNPSTQNLELRPIVGWHRNPGGRLVRILTDEGGALECTTDHRIWTERGEVEALGLRLGDKLLAAPRGMFVPAPQIIGSERKVEMPPNAAGAYAGNCAWADAIFMTKSLGRVFMALRYLADKFFGQYRGAVSESSVSLGVSNVLSPRAVFEVIKARVSAIAVLVANFLSFGARPQERDGYKPVTLAVEGLSLLAEGHPRISIDQRPGHDLAWDSHLVGAFGVADAIGISECFLSACGRPWQAFNSSESADFVKPLKSNHWSPRFVRVTGIEVVHDVPSETYCVTVEGNHNLVCGSVSNIVCSNCDDPNNVKEAESEVVRNETNRWFRESMSNRLNSMERGAIVIIMQRTHEDDVSGLILSLGLDYCHLMIPMEMDVSRAFNEDGTPITTSIGWYDPRLDLTDDLDKLDGTLAWPERFPAHVVEQTKKEIGEYAWAGQYSQSPAPRGGGLFKTAWWQVYESENGKFPAFELILASVDSAFTAKETNDPTGMTVWGVFVNEDGRRRLMLIDAWRKHLEFSGPRVDVERREHETRAAWVRRTQDKWGLMEWIYSTCEKWKVDKLLIEAKASGISAAQELRNRYGLQNWSTQLCKVTGDKYSRALAVQATFSNGYVYAPVRDWSDLVITEMSLFPNGKYDDLTDSTSQAIKWLRDNGLAPTDAEANWAEMDLVTHKARPRPLHYA